MLEKIGGGVQWLHSQCPGGKMPDRNGKCPPRIPANPPPHRQDSGSVRGHRQEKPNPCPPEQETIVKTRDKKTGQEIAKRRVQTCSEERVKLNPATGRYEATRPRQVETRPRRVGPEPGPARRR
jgi:hypothetical protein